MTDDDDAPAAAQSNGLAGPPQDTANSHLTSRTSDTAVEAEFYLLSGSAVYACFKINYAKLLLWNKR